MKQALGHQGQGPGGLRAQAEAAAARRDWPGAIGCFERLLEANPDDPDLLLQLSYTHSLAGHYRTARQYALDAHARHPTDPTVIKELIARLRTFNEPTAIRECVRRLPSVSKLDVPSLIAFGAQMSYLNLQEDALRFLDEARRADPLYPPMLLARAQILTYLGRFAEAQRELESCLRRAPQIPRLYLQLAMLGRSPSGLDLPMRIGALLARAARDEDAASLGFALHMELDRQGRHDDAWSALEAACRHKRRTLSYRLGESVALVDGLMALPTGDAVCAPGPGPTPIFIVGMHRSGTTLLEQLLDGHSGVKGIGELYDFTSAMRYATDHHCRGVIDQRIVERAGGVDFGAVGADYLRKIEWRLGTERFFTDKLPSNFLNLGFICQALPHAKILHMVRDPVETCFSNLRELFSDANPYSYDQLELAAFHGLYRRLMGHWHERFPDRILDVDYAELTRDPAVALQRVAAFCGMEFEPAMLDATGRQRGVATASAVQVRQGIQARDVPKWKPYEAHLQPLLQGLAHGRTRP